MHIYRHRYINRWTNQKTNVHLCCLQLPSLQTFVQAWVPMPLGRTRGAYICTNCGNFNELVLGSGPTRKETMGPLISGNKTSPAITCEFRGMNSESNMYVQRLLEKSHEATVMFQIVHLTLIQFSAQMARWIVEPPLFCLTRRTADRP